MKLRWKLNRRATKKFLLISFSAFFIITGLMIIWVTSLKIPDFSSFSNRQITQSTKIYDKTGEVTLFDIHKNIQRTVVPISDISRYLKNATVAIEDSEFYQHRGVRIKSIFRAFLVNLGSGDVKQGGSTITQQVIKNSLLSPKRTLARKIKELVLALKLEGVMSKDDILGVYLNEAPYGGNIYGAQEAARLFFGKNAAGLSLAEGAYLAAIPRAPTFYSPYGNNRGKLDARKNIVLSRMVELGFISQKEADIAKSEEVKFLPPENRGIKAPHFVMMVRQYLVDKYGEEAVERGGLKVTTTMDWEMQQRAEEILKRRAEENEKKFGTGNAGLVALDPKTGNILSMVGSRNYFDVEKDGNYNVTLAHRQPGSSIKPIIYAGAFLKGYTPETVLFDLPTQFDTTCLHSTGENCYSPQNFDGHFRGPITLRQSLAMSINLTSIKLLYLVGIKEAISLAHTMGIKTLTDPNRYGLTLVIGGGEVTLLDMTSAYSVFANDGLRNPSNFILKVEDSSGNVLEQFTPSPERVLPEQVARQISDILSDNAARSPIFGANSSLNLPGAAVKTGTTDDVRDAWAIGYNSSLVVGVWSGNNDNTPIVRGHSASTIAAPLWNEFFRVTVASFPQESFIKPEPTPENLPPILRGFWRGNKNYFVDKISGKLATEYTPAEAREERVVQQVHSILYWLNKDTPQDGIQPNPPADPQFALWEGPVRAWAQSQGLDDQVESVIPTTVDDIHLPGAGPQISILSPITNSNILGKGRLTVNVLVGGPQQIERVDYLLNGQFIGSSNSSPFTFSFIPSEQKGVVVGQNLLEAIVYDLVKNVSRTGVSINISI